MKTTEHTATSNFVHVNDKDILVLELHGKQGTEPLQKIIDATKVYTKKQHSEGKKTLILVDLRSIKLSDVNSQGRNAARRALEGIKVDAVACIGSGIIMNVAAYLIRLAGQGVRLQFFHDTHKAERWLLTLEHPKAARSQIALVAAILIGSIGILGVIGWSISNPYFTSFKPDLRPINPTAAVALLALSAAFFCYWVRALKPLRLLGVIGILLGIAALLPIDIDTILFHDKVLAIGDHAQLADSAGVCFILCGIMGLLARRPGKLAIIVQYVAGSAIILISFFNAFGLLYATDAMYQISPHFVMALNLSLAFAIAGASFIFLTIFRQMGGVLNRVSRVGWLIVVVLIFVQFATYAAWDQAVTRSKGEASVAFESKNQDINDAVKARVQAYVDALHGFSGLYASSSYVSEREFQTYYDSLNLANNYPGVRSVAFIARVRTNQIADFVKLHQQDDSLVPGGHPNFSIQKQSNLDPHFVATYVNDSATSSGLGLDLTSTPGRYKIYSDAVTSGSSYASGTVNFAASATRAASKGFFITIPVKNSGSSDYIGLVNVVFDYDTFFSKLFTQLSSINNLDIAIHDQKTTIFESRHKQGATAYAQTSSVAVANRAWDISIEAPADFGTPQSQARTPLLIIFTGQMFSIILILIFILQARSRQRALQLADIATIDLQKERQSIIQLNRKDEAILGSIGEGLVGFNHRGVIEVVNDAACQQLGFSREEIVGKKYTEILRATNMKGEQISEHQRPVTKTLAGHRAIETTLNYVRKDNVVFPARINVAPIKDAKGVIGAIEVFEDVTKELELDKAKSEFVSLASHQLRTPLSAINWYAEMLLGGDAGKINKDQREYLTEIYEGNKRMVELVDSLLNVSRLEVGKLKNEPSDTSMVAIADSLEKELAVGIKAHNIAYTRSIEPKLPNLFADPKLLRIILQNLLSNAVKYTPNGGKVHLELRVATKPDIAAADLPHGDYLFMSVGDTGYGIPEAQQGKIFEKLFRADNVRKLDVEGTGLGLYIVQEITKIFGGHIWFETKEGHGTTFYVVIPLKTKPSS